MKMIILGPPLVGKSTLAKHLRLRQTIEVIDFDEELFRLNNGSWPGNNKKLMEKLKKEVINEILQKKSVIFMSFECNETQLRMAREKGFRIIQLYTTYQILSERNKKRVLTDPTNDAFQFVKENMKQQLQMYSLGLVDNIINADQPIEQIASKIMEK